MFFLIRVTSFSLCVYFHSPRCFTILVLDTTAKSRCVYVCVCVHAYALSLHSVHVHSHVCEIQRDCFPLRLPTVLLYFSATFQVHSPSCIVSVLLLAANSLLFFESSIMKPTILTHCSSFFMEASRV